MAYGKTRENPKIKIFEGDEESLGVKEIISNRLYVPGWTLRCYALGEGFTDKRIAIAYVNDVAVGCCLCTKRFIGNNYFVQVFVRKAFRRRGIGSALLKESSRGEKVRWVEGLPGTDAFFVRTLNWEQYKYD